LALARLGERSLWADEGATAYLAQQDLSWGEMLRQHKQYLHLALTMGVVRIGRSEFALRLPSAVAAVLALPVVYLLGARLLGRPAGVVGAFLLSISPFAVVYAQEARVYALLEFLACLSLLALLLALDRRRWYWWVLYVGATALLLYSHFFGWFVVAAEALYALARLAWRSAKERVVDRRLLWLGGGLCLIGLLYLPLAGPLLDFWRQAGPASQPQNLEGLYPFQLSWQFSIGMLSAFGPRAQDWRLALFVAGLMGGLLSCLFRRRWATLMLLTIWFVVPLATLTLVPSSHFFDMRYLIFLLPPYLLLVGEGVVALASLLLKPVRLADSERSHLLLGLGLGLVLFVPANWQALQTHYHWEKENWRNIGVLVRQHIDEGELVFVSPLYWSRPLLYYQPTLVPRLVGGNRLEQLESAAMRAAGLWYIRYGGALGDPQGAFTEWITERDFLFLVDAHTCGSGIHVYYHRFDDQAAERQTELLEVAKQFCPADPRFRTPQN
jgi:hypothetical protein